MSEPELLKRIAELEAHNLELQTENDRLRAMLGLPQKNPTFKDTVQSPDILEQDNNVETISKLLIDKYSSPDEKIELFQSLFRGRTDVYAKRCYSKKHGSVYYIPACKNEWVKGVCDRTRIKCKTKRNKPSTKIDMKALLKDVEENPDAYQYERAKKFGVCQSTIFYALKRLAISNKKNTISS